VSTPSLKSSRKIHDITVFSCFAIGSVAPVFNMRREILFPHHDDGGVDHLIELQNQDRRRDLAGVGVAIVGKLTRPLVK
jgi:hypothetical protein